MNTAARRSLPAIAIPGGMRKARIEIIPLIDIMFFLLASFMLVSLSMVRLQGMQMTLPGRDGRPIPPSESVPVVRVQMLADGALVLGDGPARALLSSEQLLAALAARHAAHSGPRENFRVFLNIDKDAPHGSVIALLDQIKALGIERVTFSLRPGTVARP